MTGLLRRILNTSPDEAVPLKYPFQVEPMGVRQKAVKCYMGVSLADVACTQTFGKTEPNVVAWSQQTGEE
jgi:hypothetical protein